MTATLLLESTHRGLGAPFTEWQGVQVPLHFGDPVREFERVCLSAGVFDRSYRGRVSVQGRDAASFLDRMVSSEAARLQPGEGQLSALLTPKGKTVGIFRLFCIAADAFLMEFQEPPRREFLQTLSRYAFLSDMEVRDVSGAEASFSVEGPRAAEVVQQALSFSPDAPPWKRLEQVWGGALLTVRRGGESPEGGFEIGVPPERALQAWSALTAAAQAMGGGPAGRQAAEMLRIEAGIPAFGMDYSEAHFPNEAGLESALTYVKCYVGQEVVARMKTYGHTNRGLRGVKLAGDLPPPAVRTLFSRGQEAGQLGSFAISPRCGAIGLAMIGRRYWDPDTVLSLQVGLSQVGPALQAGSGLAGQIEAALRDGPEASICPAPQSGEGAGIAATVVELPFIKI